ncbi:UNKNOWN [Stylonychia lemnae]|uniref:PKD/REJ-like domain-containing protein n=1 Tax=Stylonychia lemnae TaxID=5949 RepID=A0A078ATU2_STYLE|nr:UNKNOWN [Stylonychia lemnae]|eukprot:CDW85845.1 UNKNOWN [Stylonychia lemnae]
MLVQFASADSPLLLQSSNILSTTNDGVNRDKYVNYIKLNGLQGIQLTLDTVKLNTRLDYTVMMWFKPLSQNFGEEYQYAFSFGESLECYFATDQKLMCTSESFLDRLETDISQIKTNQWYHLTIAGQVLEQSYMLIQSNALGVLAQDEGYYLDLIQTATPWKASLGGFYNQNIFIGGLRDFVFLTTFVDQLQAANLKNNYMFWDSKLNAYYRFSDQSFLQDEIKGKYIQISSGAYAKQRDLISNDICYPIETYIQLYKSQSTQDFKQTQVASRWSPKLTNWGYTVSMWIKMNNYCFYSSPTTARQNCHYVVLGDAFMIYSPAPNQISAYIYASKVYYEYQTKSIFVPSNQWVNLQFTVSQYYGYEFRTYDILSRQMDAVIETRELFSQKVSDKSLTMLKNFANTNVIKNLVVYTSKQKLPFSPPNVDLSLTDYSLSSDCLVYFDFVQKGFAGQYPRKLRNLCSSNSINPVDIELVQNSEIYQGAFWTEPVSIAGSDIGLYSNQKSLFDGIACNDGQTVPNLRGQNSYIYTKTLTQDSQLSNVTVEFWFKQGLNTTQSQLISNTKYLFSLQGVQRAREYFTIVYDSTQQKLICAPFGITSITSPQIGFTQYTQANKAKSGWYHIACSYEYQKDLIGYLSNSKLNDEILSQSLVGIPTNLPADTYEIWIGNNAQKTQGSTYLFVKEARIWAQKRSSNDIQYWRNRQIDPRLFTSDIFLAYLKLNIGQYNEMNFMQVSNPQINYPAVNLTDVLYVSDSELTICPVNTYLGIDKKCYQNPIQTIQANIYTEIIDSELNYVFSANESVIMSSTGGQNIQYQWIFDDQILNKVTQALKINRSPIMKVPSKYFKDESQYNVKLNISNQDNTFVQIKDTKFIPQSCSYYSLSSEQFLNITDPQSRISVSFMVQPVNLKSYCNEISYYNQLVQNVSYSFVPPLASDLKLNIEYYSNNSFKVTLPEREQYKIPIQTEINIIMRLQFQNTQILSLLQENINLNDTVFQNVKQTIYFNTAGQALIPAISANQTVISIGEGVVISTAGTKITYAEASDYNTVYYQWLCPESLLYYCPLVNASQITIPSNSPINFRGAQEFATTITVNITWTDKNKIEFIYNISIDIKFINQFSPVFTISPPNPLRASFETLFSLDFTNHRATNLPTTMQVVWTINPQILFAAQTLGAKNQTLKVAKQGFNYGRDYTITVVATNKNSSTLLQRTQTFTFTTQKPPQNGTASITPTSGYVNETLLTITILNWQSSNKPIKYKVFPFKDVTKEPTLALTDDWISDNTPYRFTPNDTNYYQVQITDNSGELTYFNLFPAITIKPATNASNSTGNFTWDVKQAQLSSILQTTQLSQKYSELTEFADQTLSSDQSSSQSSSDSASPDALQKIQSKIAIIDSIQKDTQQIDDPENSVIISKGSVKVLELILSETAILNDAIAQKALDILRNIYSKDNSVIENINKDPEFKQNFALVLSHLMQYDNSLQITGRLLRQENLSNLQEDIRQLKEQLTNQLCQDAVINSDAQQIDTPSFSLVIKKFSFDSNIKEAELKQSEADSPSIKFSISSITQQLKKIKSFDDAFCLETIFLNIDPSIKDTSFTQYSKSILEYLVSDEQSQESYTSSQYDPQSNVNIRFPVNPATFLNNQTVCMGYFNQQKQWSDDICETIVDTQDHNVKCNCNPSDVTKYGVFNNPARQLGTQLVFTPKPTKDTSKASDYIQVDESFSFFALILILVVFSLVLPTILLILDKRDTKAIKQRKLDNNLKQQLVVISKYTSLPYKYWITRADEVLEFSQESKTIFSHFVQELHPIVNMLAKHDVLNSRITRFISYLLQLSLYALITVLVFGPSYRLGEQGRFEYGIDQKDINYILAIGIIGSILLIPCNLFNRLYRRTIINKSVPSENGTPYQTKNHESNNMNYHPEQSSENNPHCDSSPNKELQTMQRIIYKQNALDHLSHGDLFGQSNHSHLYKYENSQDLKLQHRCRPLLLAQMAVAYICSMIAMTLCFIQSQSMPVSNQYCLVSSFYIGFFGSIIVSNLVRVAINSLLIKRYIENNGSWLLRMFLAREAIELYKEILIIRQSAKGEANDITAIHNLSQKQSRSRLSRLNSTGKKAFKDNVPQGADLSNDSNILKRNQIDTIEQIDSNNSVLADNNLLRQKTLEEDPFNQRMSPDSNNVLDFNSQNSSRKSPKKNSSKSPKDFYDSIRMQIRQDTPEVSLDRYSELCPHQSQELNFDEQDHHQI